MHSIDHLPSQFCSCSSWRSSPSPWLSDWPGFDPERETEETGSFNGKD